MAKKDFYIEILTPEERFYSGRAEMLIVKTTTGQEGFMADHSWCCTLLAEDGFAKIREAGDSEFSIVDLKGGYIDVKDKIIVYADKAKWHDSEQRKYYE